MADDQDSNSDAETTPAKPARKPRSKASKVAAAKSATSQEPPTLPAPAKAPRRVKSSTPAKTTAAKPAKRKPAARKSTVTDDAAQVAKAVRASRPAKAISEGTKQAVEKLPTSKAGVAALVGAAALGFAGALAATVGRGASKRAASAAKKRVEDVRNEDTEKGSNA